MIYKALCAAALALTVSATPIKLDRRIWTDFNCTGSSEGDTALGADIPAGAPLMYLFSDLKAAYSFDGESESGSLSHVSLCASANDTSVIKVTEGATLDLDYANLLKYGYSSNLYQASFYGVNAMINVANTSTLTAKYLNLTSHNGAAGVYVYGDDTKVNVSDSTFYATGPVSHGVYAAGNGTANITNFLCHTEGYRSSCFAGDVPVGYLTVRDSEAYTYGVGSGVTYGQGTIYLYSVHGYADVAPWTYMDGTQYIYVFDSDLEGGGSQAGVIMFSSGGDFTQGILNVTNSVLRTHGENAAALAVAGTGANINLRSVKFITESNILVTSNTSTIPQTFTEWTSPEVKGAAINAADAVVHVWESQIEGDLVAINGSAINLYLEDYSVWTGKVTLENIVEDSSAAVYLDGTSGWVLTGDSRLQNFTISSNSLSNIVSNGFNIYYNKSQPCNSWIGSTTSLSGGGSLISY